MKPNNREKGIFAIGIIVLGVILIIFAGIGFKMAFSHFGSSQKENEAKVEKVNNGAKTSTEVKQANSTNQVNDQPLKDQYENSYQDALKTEPKKLANGKYNGHGAYIINNNKTDLSTDHKKAYAKNSLDKKKRASTATAFLTKKTSNLNKNGTNITQKHKWLPEGWHQMVNLPGKYQQAYVYGHLLSSRLVGNLKDYNTSDTNSKNVIAQTTWSNQANTAQTTGQKYYEDQIANSLKQNKKIQYEVEPIYDGKAGETAVAYGVHLQAKATDNSLELNVFIPNVQGNINIDYYTGNINQN